MTREDFSRSLADERHDQRRCDNCGVLFDRADLHGGLCDWCTGEDGAA